MENTDEKLKLHAVIIKKPFELENAKNEARLYIKNPKNNFYRETKTAYRFRNIPKTKFNKKSFKTKKINKNVSLVFGILKPEFEHLEGAGFFDFFKKPIESVKSFFSPRKGYNNTTTKNLNDYGNLPVLRLTIARTPILNVLDKAVNLISFGKWNQLKKEYAFDKLFHLQLIANLGNRNLVIEKNEVINVNTEYKNTNSTETMDVSLNGKNFNVNEMLEKTRQRVGDKLFFDYDAFTNNCQVFVKECLISENLYGQREENFLFQDVSELAQKMPQFSKKIMNAITKTGAIANKLLGKGEEMDLGDEFKIDKKDHQKKLSKYEKEEHDEDEIYKTLNGLKELTNNGLKHIAILEEMLKKEGGSAQSSGFIRAIMANKNKSEPNQFKKYNREGFDEFKLKQSTENIINKKFKDKYFKDFVLIFSYPSINNLYNTRKMKEIYLEDEKKAKNALESVEELIYNKKNFMDGLKKSFPDYDNLDEINKDIYQQRYREILISTILSKYYDGMKPIKNELNKDMEKRIKENYINWRAKNKMTKRNKMINEELLKKIENMEEGEEIEIPNPDSTKKDAEQIKKEMKDNKPKKIRQIKPSKDRIAVDNAILEYMKRVGNGKLGAGFFSKNPGESIVRGLFNLGKRTVEGVINANRISNERREKEKRDNEELNRRLKDVGDFSPFSGLPTKNPDLI
jgi:hypothetical protein